MTAKFTLTSPKFSRFISIIVYFFRPCSCNWYTTGNNPESYHYPGFYTTGLPSNVGSGTEISDPADTPDYRLEEPDFTMFNNPYDARELERPFRNSPPWKQSRKSKLFWNTYWMTVEMQIGCYCCTVYRKYILLAGCAVITTRHILTTATPTALILRSYPHLDVLENVLGGWYDHNGDVFNTSLYMTPARIHMHPKYQYEHEVNVSHPIPAQFDLSIWAATYPFIGYSGPHRVITCPRAASSWSEYATTIPRYFDISMVVGFMFMKSYHRRPLPWYRYFVKTQAHLWPCPKSDWQWFHCISGEYWGRYGFDSGGGMNTAYRNDGARNDGLAGLCAFSMKLRSKQTVHYFTVVDNYPVLDFIYDAMMGGFKAAFLDSRFQDTRWGAPRPWWGEYIPNTYIFGAELYVNDSPKYRR